jgi:DtxR family transcriptional regulator, Mn-dependent transcriptional regulator
MLTKWLSHGTPPAARGETQEMILLTLARAAENGNSLSTGELARELDLVRTPLDSELRPLADQKLITISPTGMLALTDTGRTRALTLLRRHRLTERLFTDLLGLDWVRAHEEADKFEHVVSPEAEQQLATRLGDPETCPHGNPIPKAQGDADYPVALSLNQCEPMTSATISRIGLETSAALQHLATLGLLPNVEIQVENKAPFDGPVMVRVGRAHYALGHDLAARIWVRKSN